MSKKIELEQLREMLDKLFWDENMGDFDTAEMLSFMVLMDLLNPARVNLTNSESKEG